MSNGDGQRDLVSSVDTDLPIPDRDKLLADIARGLLMAHARLDDLEVRIRASNAEVIEQSVKEATNRLSGEISDLESALSRSLDSISQNVSRRINNIENNIAQNSTRLIEELWEKIDSVKRHTQEHTDSIVSSVNFWGGVTVLLFIVTNIILYFLVKS